MDFDKIFRSFFGFHNPRDGNDNEFPGSGGHGHFGFFGPGFNSPGNHGEDWDDDNDDDDSSNFRRGGFQWGSHSDEFGDFERQTQEMFRHFEEMFKNFGLSDFHSNIPSIETTPNRRSISPRDEMLKQPDEQKEIARPGVRPKDDHSQPADKDSPVRFGDVFRSPWHWNIPALPSAPQEDKDLDEQVKDGNLEEILKPRQQQPQSHFKSFSKSVSIQTVRKPDGTIEQRRTEKDSDGNVTTTVTTSEDSQNPVIVEPPSRFNRPSVWPGHQNPNSEDSLKDSLFDRFFGSWKR